MKTLFKNAYIVTCDNDNSTLIGDVVVRDNLIEYVGPSYNGEYDKLIDCTNKVLMPGFVNAHTHLAMNLFRNLGENTTFENWWYDVIRPLEAELEPQDYENGITLAILELLKNGITSFADMYMHPEITAKVSRKYGIRANICIGITTGNEIVDENFLEAQHQQVKENNPNSKVIPCVHAIYSCDEDRIVTATKYARKHKLPLTIHVSETITEVGECYTKYEQTPIGYLESLGFFDDTKTLLAHCVHCDKDDVKILAKYDTAVVSNPSSNLVLGSGVAPIYSYVSSGVPVCLGTDSAASNNALDFFKEMFLLNNLQSGVLNKADALNSMQTIKCATINGAKALGYDNLGAIAKGYLADIILIDLNAINMQPLNNNLNALVNSANVGNVCLTMVDGKILYQNGKYTFNVDMQNVFEKASNSIDRLKRIAK